MVPVPTLLNELREPNKVKRRAAYKKMRELLGPSVEEWPPKSRFDIIHSCLKGFEDSSERCREDAVHIVTTLVTYEDANILDWVLPSIVTRIGVAPVAEESEDVRLLLLSLASKCMTLFPHEIGPRQYIDFFQVLLENCFKDAYQDLKKEACKLTVQLCAIEPQQVKAISLPLARALKGSCLLYKHSAVRCEAMRALAALIKHGAVEILGDGKDESETRTMASQLFILCNDHTEAVRLATLSVLSCALLDVKERLDYHGKYLPHLLLLSTDSYESVRVEALNVLTQLGRLYMLDNEDNRIDLSSRRVTMKDIEWYGDDEYPDMQLSTVSSEEYPILASRPPLGTRYAVAEAARSFLDRILADIVAIDWVIQYSNNNRKAVALRILWNVIYHCEQSSVQHTERVLGALYKALRDDDRDVVQEAKRCVEVLGKFLTPSQYLPFIISKPPPTPAGEETDTCSTVIQKGRSKTVILSSLTEEKSSTPTLFSTAAFTTKCSVLVALGYLLLGSETKLTAAHATMIVQALTQNDWVESEHEELLLSLLDTLDTVFHVFSRRGFMASPTRPLPIDVQQDVKQRTLDSVLFNALLCIKGCEFTQVRARATASINLLSSLVTGTADGLYSLHISRLLHRFGSTMRVNAFYDLVLGARDKRALGSTLKDIFITHLADVNFSVRVTDELRYFTVLEHLLWSQSVDLTAGELEELLRLVVVPLAAFKPGSAEHLFRKVAVNCLCAMLERPYRDLISDTLQAHECALATKVIALWASASDSDDGEMRLVSVTALPSVCSLPVSSGSAHEVIQSILLRFDDANDAIRLRTASGLLAVLTDSTTTNPAVLHEVQLQMVPIVKKMLVYVDDHDDSAGIRSVLVEGLKQLGKLSPSTVADLVQGSLSRHQDPSPCQEILNYLQSM